MMRVCILHLISTRTTLILLPIVDQPPNSSNPISSQQNRELTPFLLPRWLHISSDIVPPPSPTPSSRRSLNRSSSPPCVQDASYANHFDTLQPGAPRGSLVIVFLLTFCTHNTGFVHNPRSTSICMYYSIFINNTTALIFCYTQHLQVPLSAMYQTPSLPLVS